MKIKLIRKGGFIPIKKESETEVDWTEEEFNKLAQAIQLQENSPGQKRDATTYHLAKEDKQIIIDWDKIPAKYNKVFETLKSKLDIVK